MVLLTSLELREPYLRKLTEIELGKCRVRRHQELVQAVQRQHARHGVDLISGRSDRRGGRR